MLTLLIVLFALRMMNPWRWHRPWGMFRGMPGMWRCPLMGGFGRGPGFIPMGGRGAGRRFW